ncbi:MAG: CsgG/HfaB family protein [Elusimicrobiota bacterium]|nr:CsgG/HfaB family protein [Elusimicrobiota bacterium]
MRNNNSALKLTFAAAFALVLGAPPDSAAEDAYKKMANDFAKYSTDKKVKNVTVVGFARKARTSREESEYFSEKLMSCLVASGKVNLLERSQLDKVLEERRLSDSGVTEESGEGGRKKIDPSNAIIVGTIFGTKNHLKIIAKMIDPLTGAVLHTVEGQTDRQWEILPERPEFDFEVPDLRVIAEMFSEEEIRPEMADFRDAPVSLNTNSCNTRRARLASMQAVALEAKAKYWALQMRNPNFKATKLTRNPGGEIKDNEARKKFYALLQAFHRAPELPKLSVPEMNAVITVMEEEGKISDECGLH